jgi:hypothetical protein
VLLLPATVAYAPLADTGVFNDKLKECEDYYHRPTAARSRSSRTIRDHHLP